MIYINARQKSEHPTGALNKIHFITIAENRTGFNTKMHSSQACGMQEYKPSTFV